MCNIAGYVGKRDASPILIEMMRKEQGFNGGYYTGIVNIDEGKLVSAKITGDLDTLLEKTDAALIPGHIGLLHSRSNSKGGDEWAHPFLDGYSEVPCGAYVANGSARCCANRRDDVIRTAERLEAEGAYFSSRLFTIRGKYVDLPDGSSIHVSDMMCQLVMSNIRKGMDAEAAMEEAFREAPAEIVSLFLHTEAPDRIYFARYNLPMFAGFAEDGAYLASTPLAFPEEVTRVIPIPEASAGYLTEKELSVHPMKDLPITVAAPDIAEEAAAFAAVRKALGEKECTAAELEKTVEVLFTKTDCAPGLQLAHKALYALQKEGVLEMREDRLPGVLEGTTAPKIKMWLKA